MRRPLPLRLSIAVLFVFWMSALPAAASTLAVDVVEDDLTPQTLVLALKPGPSGQVFSAAEAIEPTPEALMEDTFTLVFPRRPEALESLKEGWRLVAASELTLHDPLRLHHETTGAMVLKDDDWQWASPPSQNSMRLPAPSLQVDSRIDVGLGLLPRLELVLYAMAGPYLQAEASQELSWRHSASLEESAGLTLTGGITHRVGRWGDWEDTELVPPYRGPEAESNDE